MEKKKVTVLDVAKKAGVSPGTVSRTLNNIGYIKEETREKILDVVKEMNYIPNRAGRALKTTKTGLIVLAIPDTSNAIYFGMIEAVNECAKKRGWSMVLYYTEGKLEGELKAVRMLQENLVDGLFLINFSYADDLRAAIDSCYPAPIVLCGMCNSLWAHNKENTFDTVSIDVYKGIYDSTTHFIKKGHKRIGYLAGESGTTVYAQRYDAFCQALRDNGIEYRDEYVFWRDYTEKNGYEAAKKVFFMAERPTAIVASNDLQAIGFWKACKDYRIKVPQEIELCGMDNLDTCDIIQMSSIRMWEDAVGKAGAEMVLDRLEGAESEQHRDVVFRPTLILRDGNK